MAIVKIKGKEITLPDDVVKAGDEAIRAVLAANGFPAVEKAAIEIVGATGKSPTIVKVAPRSTGKGSGETPDAGPTLGMTVQEWRDDILSQRGNMCTNCGSWRVLAGREIVFCASCGDEAYDVYEIAESLPQGLRIVKSEKAAGEL